MDDVRGTPWNPLAKCARSVFCLGRSISLARSTPERSQQGATPPKYVDKTENSEVWSTSTTVRGPKSRLFWTCLGDHHVLSSFWRDLGGQMSWFSLQKPSIWNNSNRAGYHFPEWLPSPVIRVGVLRPWPLHSLGFDAWGQPDQGSVGPVSHRMQWGLLLRWISTSETGQKRQNRGLAGDFGVLRLTGRWARRPLEAFWSLQGDQVNSKFPLRVWARLDPASRNPHTTRMGQIWTISDFEVAIFRSQGPDQPLLFPKDRQNQVSQRTISATKPRFRASQRGLKDRIPRLGVFWRLSKPFRSWGVTVRTVFAGLGGIFQKSTANLDIRQGIPTVGERAIMRFGHSQTTDFDRFRPPEVNFESFSASGGLKNRRTRSDDPKNLVVHPPKVGHFDFWGNSDRRQGLDPQNTMLINLLLTKNLPKFLVRFQHRAAWGGFAYRKSYLIVPFLVL